MADYEVKWTEATARFLEKMESVDSDVILEKMNLVSKNPFHYIKHLKGIPLYSLRTGKYRVIMSISEIARRTGVCRKTVSEMFFAY